MTASAAVRPGLRPTFTALCCLFFVSGAAALVYQTAWHRMLGLFGGADSISAAIVVGAFLAGLGIGSLAGGIVADRLSRRQALLGFVACELGIAAFAALSPWLFYEVIFGALLPLASSRLVVSGIVLAALLWPTFLMGCSLPLLSKAMVQDIARSAHDIAWLYALNTLGAGVGALAAGWLVIGHIGYDGAVYLAAVLNMVVAAGGAALMGNRTTFAPSTPELPRAAAADGDARDVLLQWCLLVFVSGFLIVALQIVWYRLIGVLLQSNAYSFSLVLGVFLIGDAVGLAWGARIVARVADPRGLFLRFQVAAALCAIGAVLLLWLLMREGIVTDDFVDRDHVSGRLRDVIVVGATVLAIVLPASFIMGFSFPLVQKAVQDDLARVGRRVGLVQLANILGNSAGSLVTGLLLLHWFGTAGTLMLLAGLGACVAVAGWLHQRARRNPSRVSLGLVAALVLLVAALPGGAAFWRGLHGLRPAERSIVREDRSGLVLLRFDAADRGRMYIQGHSQSCLPFCTVHAFLGVIGPFSHPDPKQVLVIGSGSGGTPYAAGADPRTDEVHAIEIVAPVIESLKAFVAGDGRHAIDRFVSDRRWRIDIADGRHALAVMPRQYDVVEADAILPKTSLSGLLYSQEFFRQVRARLRPGGIYVQWAPTERSIATFRSVFPHVVMVHPALLGSDRPIDYDAGRVLARLSEPGIARHFEAAGVDLAELRQWFLDKRPEVLNAGRIIAADKPNTDLFPRDEYYLNRSRPEAP